MSCIDPRHPLGYPMPGISPVDALPGTSPIDVTPPARQQEGWEKALKLYGALAAAPNLEVQAIDAIVTALAKLPEPAAGATGARRRVLRAVAALMEIEL